MAIPLSLVARLEEIPQSSLENLGSRQVVQYRGEILPLVDVSRELDLLRRGSRAADDKPRLPASDTIPVVVCGDADQWVGLIVGKILDIAQGQISARSRATRPGVLFTAIVQDRVTEFVDVAALLREASTGHSNSTT
jgi:two-component system, chemotaxis family, sensor kinase CheA